ncbi:MAG TPA: kelch repeat-containing protein [Terriglobales bacterium]|nr:kelch repeat-containing protein [Terriglobales bacterium]
MKQRTGMRSVVSRTFVALVILQLASVVSAQVPDTFTAVPGGMTSGRTWHKATLLNNGKVLVVGGAGTTAELYDPLTNTFAATQAGMTVPRQYLAAAPLNDGKVLVVGGEIHDGASTSSAEVYDPATDSFTATLGGMSAARYWHTATMLNNGKVLVAGGCCNLASAELYDPSTGTFTVIPSGMTAARYHHTATLLNDGKVLIAGGFGSVAGGGFDYLASAELYDPSANSFTAIPGGMTSARAAATATLLNNGEVLLTGGHNGFGITSSAERYDPTANTFAATDGNMTSDRLAHTATLLSSGKVLVAGGGSADLYHPLDQPVPLLQQLVVVVASYNLQQGISNSLDTKLQNVLEALNEANAGQRADAANKLQAFINAVDAQRDKELTSTQADELTAMAMRILSVL